MLEEQITYRHDVRLSVDAFVDVLNRSTLGERRPVGDPQRVKQMLDHANILVTAWLENQLVGVSRALTDFSFCCYLSDLAVDKSYQRMGIGKRLIQETHRLAGDTTTLILLAAPAATTYYPRIGMENFPHCFITRAKE